MNLPDQIADPPELATSHYWESRATTAELKIKEWSVLSVEQEKRIRELEEHLRQLQSFEIANVEMAQRIAKAREILEKASDSADYLHRSTLLKALEALEGK